MEQDGQGGNKSTHQPTQTHPAEDQKGECRRKEGGEEGEKSTTTILWRSPFENKGEILSR